MIRHYRRLPAALVLLVAIGLGALYVWKARASGSFGSTASLTELAKRVKAGTADADTCCEYGRRLAEANPPRFVEAIDVYRDVLRRDAYHREARVGCATVLAQAKKGDELYTFLRDLLSSDAKLTYELFERREVRPYLGEARFASLQKDAQAQAMD